MNTEGAIDFQILLEKRIGKIYRKIAEQFEYKTEADAKWIAFWELLSADEKDHAALLAIEKGFLQSGTRISKPKEIEPEVRREFETLLTDCENRIHAGITQKESIEILKALENSELNNTFTSLLDATDSKVLSHLAHFSRAHADHDHRIQAAIQQYGQPTTPEKTLKGQKESCDV